MLFYVGIMDAALVSVLRKCEARHLPSIATLVELIVAGAGFSVGVDFIDTALLTPGTDIWHFSMFIEDAGEFWCFTLAAIVALAIQDHYRAEARSRVGTFAPMRRAQAITAMPPL